MEEDAKGCLGVEKSKELDKWGGEKKGVVFEKKWEKRKVEQAEWGIMKTYDWSNSKGKGKEKKVSLKFFANEN